MAWTFTSDLDEFPDAAAAWLRRDPVRNTVPLTVIRRLQHGLWREGAMLGWLTTGGEVRGAVLHTPPYPLLLGDIPLDSVPSLADALGERDLSGVNGPLTQVEAFVAVCGRPETSRISHRLYRLETLQRPPSPGGTSRLAGEADTGLAVRWMGEFQAEADPLSPSDNLLPQVEERIGHGEFVLWEDGGQPVALAGFFTPIMGMSRIGPVYTPPELRRRGYGSVVTHAATRAAQEAGADLVLLFTDLANPTSNSIYQALGYRPVTDYAIISLARRG
ncbi:GNAT family N-acetyltransferase [Sphaerisporangium flaviroseum]|uniref:GNAT family N-acetyltransferase n=1 Tax=Sphaerisporangium flaviroseum TaxID=509199 RepID=A0ABP7HZ35_9ACTN